MEAFCFHLFSFCAIVKVCIYALVLESEQMIKNCKKHILCNIILSAILLFAVVFAIIFHKSSYPSELSKFLQARINGIYHSSSITAEELIADLTVGWNLGNSLDSCTDEAYRSHGTHPVASYETAWGNPSITKEFIDSVAASGFRAIRIPVTWYYNTYEQDNRLYIRQDYLQRVAEVVQYALDNDMYVILNSHHDAPILWADMNDINEVSNNAVYLWGQIATYFKDYDYHLIFESYNELNTKNDSWVYSDGASNATNILNQLFVNAVRESGGNNTDRVLICGTFLNGTSEEILTSFVLPSDSVKDRLLVEVHCYDTAYDQSIDTLFQRLDEFSKQQNAPVIIGEFGTTKEYTPSGYRGIHAGNFVSRASEYGLKCFWWDDGTTYQLFDRNSGSIVEKDIYEALMNPVSYETEILNTYHFNTINDFSYARLNTSNGSLEKSSTGSLTLNVNSQGLAVLPDTGYRITLHTKENGDGIRISGIAFFNQENQFISYTSTQNQTVYDIASPENAAYMKVSIHNPWGYRFKYQYQSYLKNGDLAMEIISYRKTS